jgi:hypothetical protein
MYNILSYFSSHIYSFVGIPTRVQATYNWPCEKHGFSRLMPQTLSDCLRDLFIDIANRNCNRLKPNGISLGIKGIRGIETTSPFYFPFKIVASMTLFINFFTGK